MYIMKAQCLSMAFLFFLLNELALTSLRLQHCFYYTKIGTVTYSELDICRLESTYLNKRGEMLFLNISDISSVHRKNMFKAVTKVKIQRHQVSTLEVLTVKSCFLKIIFI